jgi:hypothetical protein
MVKKSGKPADPEKVVIYIEVAPWIKQAMEEIAAEHDRSLTGEATVALKQYIEAHKREKGGAK